MLECSKLQFPQQSLLCLFQKELKQSQGFQSHVSPSLITRSLSVQRNEHGQLYVVQGLERSLHLSIPTSSTMEYFNQTYPSLPNSTDTRPRKINSIFVPNTSNYISRDVAVINSTPKSSVPNCPIQKCNELVTNMFKAGLSNVFKYQEKKRSGTLPSHTPNCNDEDVQVQDVEDLVAGICSVSIQDVERSMKNSSLSSQTKHSESSNASKKKRQVRKKKNRCNKKKTQSLSPAQESALPTITLGWTLNDAHRYKDNKSTIFGNIKPFLRDGGLDDSMKMHLLEVVKVALTSIPEETTCFDINDDSIVSDDFKKARMDMISDFYKLLGGKGDCNFCFFHIKGITIIIPLGIGPHRDILNCFLQGMSSVLQINTRIPMNETTIPGG